MKKLFSLIIVLSMILSLGVITVSASDNLLKGAVITSNTNSADTSFLTDGVIQVAKGAECTQTRTATYFLIDFGVEKEVDTLELYEFNAYKSKRLYGYKVETSSDGEKFKQILELSEENAVCDESLSETLFKGTISFNPVKTRYLKLTIRKAKDVENPDKTAVGYTAELIALLKGNNIVNEPVKEEAKSSLTITSNTNSADTSLLTDGVIQVAKGAECTQTRTATYFLIDFGEKQEVNTIELYEFNAYKSKRLYGYKIEISEDGEKFKQISELSEENTICDEDLSETLYKGTLRFDKVNTRYIKLTIRKAKDIENPDKTAVGYTAELKVFLDEEKALPEAEDNSLYKVKVNGKRVVFDVEPLNENGRLLVPFRAICEALGMEVLWDAETRKITTIKGAKTVIMTIDSTSVSANGNLFTTEVAPKIHNSRTVVPLRFLAEAIGCSVEWDSTTNTASIYTDGM